jgi:hypothetical protein
MTEISVCGTGRLREGVCRLGHPRKVYVALDDRDRCMWDWTVDRGVCGSV